MLEHIKLGFKIVVFAVWIVIAPVLELGFLLVICIVMSFVLQHWIATLLSIAALLALMISIAAIMGKYQRRSTYKGSAVV